MTHLFRRARRRAPVLLVAVVALTVTPPAAVKPQTTSAADGVDTDGLAPWLGGAGLALGAAALLIATLSTRRRTA